MVSLPRVKRKVSWPKDVKLVWMILEKINFPLRMTISSIKLCHGVPGKGSFSEGENWYDLSSDGSSLDEARKLFEV